MRYLIVVEQLEDGYEAYAPDFPWLQIFRPTRDEALSAVTDHLKFHIQGLREDGDPLPEPTVTVAQVDVPMPASVPS